MYVRSAAHRLAESCGKEPPGWSKLVRDVEQLCDTVTIDKDDFSRLKHICDRSGHFCEGTTESSCRVCVVKKVGEVVNHLMHPSTPAMNRWQSCAPLLALLSFLVLLGMAGRHAWLHVWPLDKTVAMLLAASGEFQKEQSKRLHNISAMFCDIAMLITVTMLNVVFLGRSKYLLHPDQIVYLFACIAGMVGPKQG